MTDSKHTNDNNSLFTRIQVKSPCADERYSAGNSLARLMTRIHADAVNKARPERNYTKAYRIWLAAASLMIVFLTSGWLATALRPAPEMLIRNNAWEKVENLTLADGTQLTLNRGAQLIYPEKFAGKTREIFLSGEAYFDVAEDGRPFQVITSQGEVTVLGTAFGISSYMDKAEYTTLVRGCVRYTSHTKKSVILSPGEQAILERSGELISRKVEVEEYVGWKDGVFVFRDKPLEEIMETLSRWYGSEVVFRNEEMKQLKYTGSLERYDSINTFLQVLERLQDIHYEIDNNKILLSRKSS